MNAIEISEATRRFGSTVAVDRLSLEVAKGEIFALVGPDGAGKTTLMRLICGALALDAGTLHVDGVDVVRETARVQGAVGYMPQRFSLYPDLSVMENLRFYGDIFGVPTSEFPQRAKTLLEDFSLTPFGGRLAEQLSGGMKQKLALACTLIHRPSTILLDEPTAGVDPISRREFWRILYDINRSGTTIFVSTPYMDEADRAHHVAFMSGGRILNRGTPEELKDILHSDIPQKRGATRAANEISVRAEALTRRFGTFVAVDNISFDIHAGEIWGFLGPNGAGKSTAIRMLCGVLEPSSGQVEVLGYDVARDPEPVKLRIGYMSQGSSLWNDMTIEEHLRFYAGLFGLYGTAQRDAVEEWMKRVGLTERRKQLVGSLPGGYRKRLALACTLLHRPQMIFLDEPTSGVDPASRHEFWDIIVELADAGTTVMVTTHYMEEAEHCDQLAFIYGGRIVAQGTPAALKREAGVTSLEDVFVKVVSEGSSP